jgi:hypothetical protein
MRHSVRLYHRKWACQVEKIEGLGLSVSRTVPQPRSHPGLLVIPAQGRPKLSSAEDTRLLTTSSSASSSEPQPEEPPHEPGALEAPRSSPKPITKTNMVAHEVRVKVTGGHPNTTAGKRELFTEETTSVLVFENGGVIQLSAAVAPGQLLFLANVESKREVVAQVKRKRAYKPTICYVELEFAEPAPRFWGMEFSAASALLPKDAKEAEVAAGVISAEATADEPAEPPPSPPVEEVWALRREVEALREQPKSMQTSSANPQAQSWGAVPDASPQLAATNMAGTESDSHSKSNPAPGVTSTTEKHLPVALDSAPVQWAAADLAQLPQPSSDFAVARPKAKRPFRARGKFTPGFRGGVLRLALLTTALALTATGAAWYKHWIPWQSAAKQPSVSMPAIAANTRTSLPPVSREAAKEHSDFINAKVASDAPVTSPSMPARAAESSAERFVSGGSMAQPAVRTPPAAPLTGKRAVVPPTAVVPSDLIVPSAAEGVIVPPRLIKSVRAVASLDALHDFETGNVVLDAVVGTEGEVHFIRVISGPPSLRAPAVGAVKQYRYEPATRNGQPVPAHVNITIRFRFES